MQMNMEVDLDGLFRHNDTYNYEDYVYPEDSELRDSKLVFIPPLYSVEFVIGLLGNGLVLAVLAQSWKRRSWCISDTFIFHLSIADVLLLVMLPIWAAQATDRCEWCFSGFLCKFSGIVFNINFYCGILLLVCIIQDRYLSIIHAIQPFSQKRPRVTHISCLVVWLISMILTIPDWIFVVAMKDPAQEKTLCVHKYSDSTTDWQLLSRLVHHILGFLLPVSVLITCCSCILLRLQSSSKGLQKLRSIKVILPLVVVFLLCWMPYNITLIVDTVRSRSEKPNDSVPGNPEDSLKVALIVTSALGCTHACLRPLLYFGLCRNFRKQTLAMLRCATVESGSLLWDLGVGEKALPDQIQEREEMKQMRTADNQVQLTQC